jgi:hypothetical protein
MLLSRPIFRDSALVVAGAVPSLAILLRNPRGNAGIILIALGTATAIWAGTRREFAANPGVVAATLLTLAIVAVARAPFGSHDMWSYAMYGRILEHYRANPYVVLPSHFTGDRVLALVGWRHTPSAYGPLFTMLSAVVSRLAGTNLLALRLGFQIPVAAAVLASIWMVARTTGSMAAAALIGLQPLMWCSVVNGGHNDAFVGLAAVAAVVLAGRRRPVAAAFVLGAAGLVKSTALLALPVLLVALIARRAWRAAAGAAMAALAPFIIGTALAPRSLTSGARATRGIISRAAPWRLLVARDLVMPSHASTLAVGSTAVIVAVIAWRSRRHAELAGAIALALLTYSVVGSYVLPWYCVWSIPVSGMARRRAIPVLAAVHGALLFSAYQFGAFGAADKVAGGLLTRVVPIATVVVFLVVVWGARGKPALASPVS